MRFAILLTTLGASVLCAQSPPFVMVNAASYGTASAPEALATIFGSNLAQATASATLDTTGQLPTELAATRVEIAGVAASLFYVSPGQINLVVPVGIDPGTVDVVIRGTASGTSKTATALLRTAAPGVFTSDASGTGPGAILNAVTYRPSPFVVQTVDNGADTRTRLAVYGTGFRHAKIATATARDASGNSYPLHVEYAALAPGFFGLDQVNILIPPDLDGAGTVSLLLGADNNAANQVTFRMNLMAAGELQLASLTVAPAFLNAGDSATLTVGLNGVARTGGFPVSLRSDVVAAQVPAQVLIPEGKASLQTTLTTLTVPAPVHPTITAQAGGVTQTTSIEIDPPNTVQLVALAVSSASILGGRSLTGTVTLSGNAAGAGVTIAIASDNDSVPAPGVVTVPFGKSSVDFPLPTLAVTQPQTVTLTASYGRASATAKLTLLPPMQLTLDADSVVGGNAVSGTIALGGAAPATGATIQLQSSDPTVARTPQIPVTIASGQTSQTFTIATFKVQASRVVNITATYGILKTTIPLTVTPQLAATLAGLTIAPDHVTGGNSAQGTVTLAAPATLPTAVTLSSNSSVAAVPGLITVPQGQSSASFPITTTRVPALVTVTATLQGVSKAATLTVQ